MGCSSKYDMVDSSLLEICENIWWGFPQIEGRKPNGGKQKHITKQPYTNFSTEKQYMLRAERCSSQVLRDFLVAF